MQQKTIKPEDYNEPEGGLRQCEMCKRVYSKAEWKNHASFELKRRKSTAKIVRHEDGFFHCPLLICEERKYKSYSATYYHMSQHHVDEFTDEGLSIKVSSAININYQ